MTTPLDTPSRKQSSHAAPFWQWILVLLAGSTVMVLVVFLAPASSSLWPLFSISVGCAAILSHGTPSLIGRILTAMAVFALAIFTCGLTGVMTACGMGHCL
ncbi:hypothetical protein [Leeia aquatica]|uniref:hypothetical protein n=1 Tax=Leeia aquatica TaxID=2725557 RepID=UPI00145794AA|nr:hypothetical protein [Leeia aquatica]